MQILNHRIQIEGLELLGVVELLAHRIGQRGVPMEQLDVERVGPPVTIPAGLGAPCERALAHALVRLRVHHGLLYRFMAVYRDTLLPATSVRISAGDVAPQD